MIPIPIVVALISAVAMDAVAAVSHRLVMHRRGWRWHRSHHEPGGGLEHNDLFPLCFASATIALIAGGTFVERLRPLAWAGTGITAYGAAYLLVHDVALHGRVPRIRLRRFERSRYVRWVRAAHRVHHLFDGPPYGFLLPVVPADLRRRAAASPEEPLPVTAARVTV